MRSLSTKALFGIALACAVIALGVLPAVFPAEQGGAADAAWLGQVILLLACITALVLGVRSALRGRRSDKSGG